MKQDKPLVLQISPSDKGGGAELTALGLFKGLKAHGFRSLMVVGKKNFNDAGILEIDNDGHRNWWVRSCSRLVSSYDRQTTRIRGVGRILRLIRSVGQLRRVLRYFRGYEDFDFPGSVVAIERALQEVDLVHCHNLHGGYFDLRYLKDLSKSRNLVISLHDSWLFSGHCAFSFDCEKWKTGCGQCPDLTLYPEIRKDKTAQNWAIKNRIFNDVECYLVAPSNWLMKRAEQSLLNTSIKSSVVIPGAVDISVFYPRDKTESRYSLGIDDDTRVVMIAATGLVDNPWKDFATLLSALTLLANDDALLVLAVGSDQVCQTIGNITVRYVPYISSPNVMADYYNASDVYVHCAKIEVFGNVLLEARACGVPVVASSVGGIPEHVKGLEWPLAPEEIKSHDPCEADGVLCEVSNANAIAAAISLLLKNDELRLKMGNNGFKNVTQNFTLDHQLERYLRLYRNILSSSGSKI